MLNYVVYTLASETQIFWSYDKITGLCGKTDYKVVLLELENRNCIQDDEHETSASELICARVAATETAEDHSD